jgi:hypothetical protein
MIFMGMSLGGTTAGCYRAGKNPALYSRACQYQMSWIVFCPPPPPASLCKMSDQNSISSEPKCLL